jgi:hypothetical protein
MNGTIDLDSFPVPVHGRQEGGAYNGHYRDTVYHPLVASFSPGGDYDSHRLVLVIVDEPDPRTGQLQLIPHYFFLITNWREDELSADELLGHYRRRGTFEDRLGEISKDLILRLSSPKFHDNEATLLLFLLGYNLLNMIPSELESTSKNGWDMGRVQKTVLKAGARVVTKSHRRSLSVIPCPSAYMTRSGRPPFERGDYRGDSPGRFVRKPENPGRA